MITFTPNEAIAETIKAVFKAYLVFKAGVSESAADFFGAVAAGIIRGIAIRPGIETIKSSLDHAISRAWDVVLYDSGIPEECEKTLKEELMTVENAISVVNSKHPENTLRTVASGILKQYVDWDAQRINEYAREISEGLMSEIYQELDSNGILNIIVAIDSIGGRLQKIDLEQERFADDIRRNNELLEKLVEAVSKTIINDEQEYRKKYVEDKSTLLKYSYSQVDNIKKQLIFPWFHKSKSLHDVFPKLFVRPVLTNAQSKTEERDLSSYYNCNLMILGEAGTGKSTLLKYWYAFEEKKFTDDTICLYFEAASTAMANSAFKRDFSFAMKDKNQHYLIIIDGLDETYLMQPHKYRKLMEKLKMAVNCNFWLGCRQDFYVQQLSDATKISDYDFVVQEWSPEQIRYFVDQYSRSIEKPDLQSSIERIIAASRYSDSIQKMMKNPFQLSVLVFLAEQPDEQEIHSTFDLYNRFITLWVEREIKRNTSKDSEDVIYDTLYDAAKSIYYNNEYVLNEVAENNTAINGLLRFKAYKRNGRRVARSFYHRSLAAFIIANCSYQAIYEGNARLFGEASEARSMDDITNFLVEKFASIERNETFTLKKNLIYIYNKLSGKEEKYPGAMQQIIYYITRLGIDVSDFIVDVINSDPKDRYIRLSLAYGCVLSENKTMRQYALTYAKNIAADPDGEDAVTNRGWTAVYFNDVNIDELKIDIYDYRDTIKGSWKNSRKARIERFTRKEPRLKDLRFWIFDIPLFHSYLTDRGWDGLSFNEYGILEGLKFDRKEFNDEEKVFLKTERDKLLNEYKAHLEQLP